MTRHEHSILRVGFLLFPMLVGRAAPGQGYDNPLTVQGLDHVTLSSAASRAAGATIITAQNDVSLMFANPASLQSLQAPQISFGGMQQYDKTSQVQQFSPLKYYPNFSLLMEGLTGYIPNPDTGGANAGDTVQRPFDNIGPNWSRTKDRGTPIQAFVAVPFSVMEMRFTLGAGVIEYADLNHFYQNNNVLSPSILSLRPVPVPRPTDSMFVHWSQYYRSRQGAIRGYGGALSGSVTERISLGVSGMILKGSSDDAEQHVARGLLTFYPNYFRIDSVYGRLSQAGTSDYTGQEFTVSAVYRGPAISLGFSVKPPSTIKRTYSAQVRNDTTGSTSVTTVSGSDKIRLPWRGTVGGSISMLRNLTLALEYEVRSYASATYTANDGTTSDPWLSSSEVHVGAEFTPLGWLTLRAGMRGQSEVFEETGNPLPGDPVTYTIYSAGFGIRYSGMRFNVAYEYGLMKYQDIWEGEININHSTRHSVIADVSYDIPWSLQE